MATWESARRSYDEALLFLKHQDDKINRVLTALAFLTAAGVALYTFSNAAPASPVFRGSSIRADDYFFGCFIAGVFFSVSLALVALEPTSFVPAFFRHDGGEPSILYWRAIAACSPDEWNQLLDDRAKLEKRLERSFHADAHRLANRAVHKVRRFNSATVFVQFTVVTLTLLGLTRLTHVRPNERSWLVVAVLIAYTALPLIDFLYFRFLDFPDVGPDYGPLRPFLMTSVYFGPFISVSTVGLALRHDRWQAITFSLAGTLVLRLLARFEWAKFRRGFGMALLFASLAMTAAGGVWLWCST